MTACGYVTGRPAAPAHELVHDWDAQQTLPATVAFHGHVEVTRRGSETDTLLR